MPETTFPFPPTPAEAAAGRALRRILVEERAALAEAIALAYQSREVYPLAIANRGEGIAVAFAVPKPAGLSGHQRMAIGALEGRLTQRLAASEAASALAPDVLSALQVGVTATSLRASFEFRGEWGDVARGGVARVAERALAIVRGCGPDLPARAGRPGTGGGHVVEFRLKRGASTVVDQRLPLPGDDVAAGLRRALALPAAIAAIQGGLHLHILRVARPDNADPASPTAALSGEDPLSRLIRAVSAD